VTAAPNPRLLVVDDEPDLRTLYELTLLREGYDVESAGSVTSSLTCGCPTAPAWTCCTGSTKPGGPSGRW
jgi:CheY-like chemotaxis protein